MSGIALRCFPSKCMEMIEHTTKDFRSRPRNSRNFLVRKVQAVIFSLDSLILVFLIQTIQDETLMHLRQQCHFAEELKKIMSLNMDKVTIAIALFGNFGPS